MPDHSQALQAPINTLRKFSFRTLKKDPLTGLLPLKKAPDLLALKAFNLAYPQDPSPCDQQIRRQGKILPLSPAQSTAYHPSLAFSL